MGTRAYQTPWDEVDIFGPITPKRKANLEAHGQRASLTVMRDSRTGADYAICWLMNDSPYVAYIAEGKILCDFAPRGIWKRCILME